MPRKRTQFIYNKQIKSFDSCFALRTELKCVRFIVLKDNSYCLNGVSLLQTDNLGMKKETIDDNFIHIKLESLLIQSHIENVLKRQLQCFDYVKQDLLIILKDVYRSEFIDDRKKLSGKVFLFFFFQFCKTLFFLIKLMFLKLATVSIYHNFFV